MDGEKRTLEVNHHEHGVLLNALNEYRNGKLAEGYTTDIIDEVLLKVIDAPRTKDKRRRSREAER